MLISTTYNLKADYYDTIVKASLLINLSMSDIVILLMKKVFSNNKKTHMKFSRIKYQKSSGIVVWRHLHASLPNQIYEKSIDIKKILKKSISYYLSEAVDKYLNEIINDYFNDSNDNYNASYISIIKKIDGIYTHTVIWGFIEEKILEKLIE